VEWKVEVSLKPNINDAIGSGIVQDIKDLGIQGVGQVRTAQLYWLGGNITDAELEKICAALLTDSVTQHYTYSSSDKNDAMTINGAWVIEVNFKPGVTDSVGDSVVKGIKDLGISGIEGVRTGQKYVITGDLTEEQIETISKRLLANEVIHNFVYSSVN